MIVVATLLWEANRKSRDFSSSYTEAWAEKLYRGFARNLTRPFRFICYTDRPRVFAEPIEQRQILDAKPSYASCIQPYELDVPMILVGLDTVVVGNCDALADYCLSADVLAVPRDPYNRRRACNGVALVPGGQAARMWGEYPAGTNDMEWINANPHAILDDLFPGACVSFKKDVAKTANANAKPPADCAPDDRARIVYFHGRHKAPELPYSWIAKNWR